MGQLGPFERRPLVAVAVSGGADSMAAALLVRDWTRAQGGDVLALLVDHGLRAESADEMALTLGRLRALGIPARSLALKDLARGPGLAERARDARHAALERACTEGGILHLVYGHHAADQAETVTMRMLAGSRAFGLAAMAGVVETAGIRRLRPLLTTPPARLRATLRAAGVAWVEDPSNADQTQQRARLRALRADAAGDGLAIQALSAAAIARGAARTAAEQADALALARAVSVYPEGFALLRAPLPERALAVLLRLVAGAERAPSPARLGELAARPCAATMAGVRITPAGRLGPGWLLTREPAAIAGPVPAAAGRLWDGRFLILRAAEGNIGAWGAAAPRDRQGLPSAVLQTMPALRQAGQVIAAGSDLLAGATPLLRLQPRGWMTGAGFRPLFPFR